jgi:hypothetical protein
MFYLLGSAFYGVYFYVSFPMYARMDEKLGECQRYHKRKSKVQKWNDISLPPPHLFDNDYKQRRSLSHPFRNHPGCEWGLGRVAVDSLGASMLVTIVLDLWRLALGPLAGNVILSREEVDMIKKRTRKRFQLLFFLSSNILFFALL